MLKIGVDVHCITCFSICMCYLIYVCSIASGFQGIYDVEHFIKTLKYDVKIVGKIPDVLKNGKTKKIKAFQVQAQRKAFVFI